MMTKLIVGSLLAALAMPTLAEAAAPRNARAAAVANWKASLRAARLQQLQARRNAAVATRTAAAAARTAAAAARSAAVAATHQYAIDRFQALRDRNPTAFDRQFPNVGRILVQDQQLRAAKAQGLNTLNGLLPDTPLNRYLHWRRSLDPARFDRNHPMLGPILEEDDHIREHTNPTPVPGETIPPPDINPPDNPPPGGGGNGGDPPPVSPPPIGGGGDDNSPPAVPEPTGILLLVIGLGVVGWVYRKRACPTPTPA